MGERGVLSVVDAVGFHGFPGTWDSEAGSWGGWDLHLGEMRQIIDRYNATRRSGLPKPAIPPPGAMTSWNRCAASSALSNSLSRAPTGTVIRILPRMCRTGGAVVRSAPLPPGHCRSCWSSEASGPAIDEEGFPGEGRGATVEPRDRPSSRAGGDHGGMRFSSAAISLKAFSGKAGMSSWSII